MHLRNIIAQYQPTHKKRIALISHWDTRPYADREIDVSQQNKLPDGANDGGSGTAIMLEIARLTKEANLDLGIDFFFSTEKKPDLPNMIHPSTNDESYCLEVSTTVNTSF